MEYVDDIEVESDNWTDKHKPQKISDIVGNSVAVNSIINWLQSFETNKNNAFKKNKRFRWI
jgi:hypothetical protein